MNHKIIRDVVSNDKNNNFDKFTTDIKNIKNKKNNYNFDFYTYVGGKTINIETGIDIKTENDLNFEEIENLYFSMSNVIENNYMTYFTNYNNLHGDGAYERFYCPLNNFNFDIYNEYDECENDSKK